MKQRFLSTFLALALCLSLLPTAALANNASEPDPGGGSIAEITVTRRDSESSQETTTPKYAEEISDLAGAFESTSANKIKLLKDVTLTTDDFDSYTAYVAGTLVLDLNGHALEFSPDVEILKSGTLTIMDSGKGGSFSTPFLRVGHIASKFVEDDENSNGNLLLSGGTLNGTVLLEQGTVRISGGKVADKVTARYDGTPDDDNPYVNYSGSVTVTGGEIETLEIPNRLTFDISGGTIGTLALGSLVYGGISGGSFGEIGYDNALSSGGGSQSVVDYLSSGCAFYKGDTLVNAALSTTLENVTVGKHAACTFDDKGWCACGRSAEDADESGKADALAFVDYGTFSAYITDTDELARLFESSNRSSFTLKLMGNVDLSAQGFYVNTPVTLDLNGYTLTADMLYIDGSSLTVMDSSTVAATADHEETETGTGTLRITSFRIEMGAHMTLNSGTVQYVGSYNAGLQVVGTMTINGGTFNCGVSGLSVYTSGGLTVNGGELTLTKYTGSPICLVNDSDEVSSLSTIALDKEPQQDTTHAEDAGDTMRVNGGKVYIPILVSSGTTLTVTGGEITDDQDHVSSEAGFNYEGGVSVNGGIVNISGGQIQKLGVYPDSGGDVNLSGGSFISIEIDEETEASASLLDFLADGYAYYDVSAGTKGDLKDASRTQLTNVMVDTHTHTYKSNTSPLTCDCGATAQNQPVKYIDAYGKTQYCTDYTVLTSSTTTLSAGWYVVEASENGTTISGNVTLNSGKTTHIILCDGAKLEVNGYIFDSSDSSALSSLAIYGQSTAENTMGQLTAKSVVVQTLTVNGGRVEFTSDVGGAIIANDLTVNGGQITAAASAVNAQSYGINVSGTMTVNAGTVTATGSNTTANDQGYSYSYGISAENLTVKGGAVTATGGTAQGVNGRSCGVFTKYLTVSGGKLYAKAAAADESFDLYAQQDFSFTGGTVRQSKDTAAVVVGAVYLYAYGADTLKLAEGSWLTYLYAAADADFYDFLADTSLDYGYLAADQNYYSLDWYAMEYYHSVKRLKNDGGFCVYRKTTGTSQEAVKYLDETGQEQTRTSYTELTEDFVNAKKNTDVNTVFLPGGWYVVKEDLTIGKAGEEVALALKSFSTHLILCNGATLTVNGCIYGGSGSSYPADLTIYAQPAETGKATGKLTVNRSDATDSATGISLAGVLTVNGGEINVTTVSKIDTAYNQSGFDYRAAYGIDATTLTINGGKVTATGGERTLAADATASSYSNRGVYAGTLTVNGGELHAYAGEVLAPCGNNYGIYVYNDMTVNGGTVTAETGKMTVGSTKDYYSVNVGIDVFGGLTVKNDGKVTAKTGDITSTGGEESWGAGLYVSDDLTVTGSTVTTQSGKMTLTDVQYGSNYGIYTYGDTRVTNSILTATADAVTVTKGATAYSCGIYSGYGDITAKNSTVTAKSGTVNLTADSANESYNSFYNVCIGIYLGSNTLRVDDSTITVESGNATLNAAGTTCDVESGCYGLSGSTTINSGTVTVTSGNAAITNYNGTNDRSEVGSYALPGKNATISSGELTATSGKASATNCKNTIGTNSYAIGASYLTVYGGTVTAKADHTAAWNDDVYVSYKFDAIGGTVQSDANGGAVKVHVGVDEAIYAGGSLLISTYGLNAKGSALKLAKDSEIYSLKVSNGAKLADLLESGYHYSRATTSDYPSGTVTRTAITDLSGALTGSMTGSTSSGYTVTYYTVDADSASNSGNSNSSGSSNPTVSTDTTTNPDGSTTKTEVKKDGTVIETTKKPDGSTVKTETKTETKKDGTTIETVTETTTSAGGQVTKSETTTTTKTDENGKTSTTEVTKTTTPDGSSSTTTTVTDVNGSQTTSTVTVGSKAASEAEKNGEAVELPIEAVKPGSTTTITVDVPKGGATIEIPVENPTPGTVVVIVNKDGTETIIPSSKVTENGIEVTLTEDATIKVIDNSKTFTDVPANAYFANAVKWAAARGITGGITATTFGPHQSCTRAQLVTFLWRAAGQPKATSASGMTDVSADAYYSEAVAWAFENGIVGGYGNGLFGVNDTITRQQMAVILYRFAQAMGMDTTQGGMAVREYKDFDSIADYAVSAMQWAVNAGILQGNNGALNPTAPCTRAQIVTMLYRLLGE